MSKVLLIALCLFAFISCEIPVFAVDTTANALNSFKVEKGQQFKVKLAGNPTTGYSWFLLNVKKLTSTSAVQNVDTNEDGSAGGYVSDSDKENKGLVGVGGNFFFTFKAVTKTTEPAELLFSYQRPWEKKENDENAVKVKITVE